MGHLQAGGLVAFPTEGLYEVAAFGLAARALERLVELAGADEPLAVLLSDPGELPDWLPGISAVGKRLAKRGWPGPLSLLSGVGVERGLLRHLPGELHARLLRHGQLALRIPAHEAPRRIARQLPGPLVMAPVHLAAATLDPLLHKIATGDLALDAGPCLLGQPSTIVGLEGRRWQVQRPGAFPVEDIKQLAWCQILFVCTGNTCRSPLAAALFASMLAERLGCTSADLPARGYVIASAGLAAYPGEEASPEAVAVARDLGCDLSGHRSRPLSMELAASSDFLFAMTASHLRYLEGLEEAGGPRPRLLSPCGEDVLDPIGGPREIYEACARQLLGYLEEVLPELLEA